MNQFNIDCHLDGGSGAGVNISPVAFLVIQENNIRLLPVNYTSAIDKLLDYVPDLMDKVNCVINRTMNDKQEELKRQHLKEQMESLKNAGMNSGSSNNNVFSSEQRNSLDRKTLISDNESETYGDEGENNSNDVENLNNSDIKKRSKEDRSKMPKRIKKNYEVEYDETDL